MSDAGVDIVGGGRRPRRSPVRLAALGVAAVLVVLIVILAVSKTHTESANSPLLGRVAPPLAGETIDGESFDLTDQRGRWVVVNFFASWCQPCIDEAPELRRWAQRQQATDDGAELVNVLFQDTAPAARAFFERNGGASWPVLVTGTDTIGLDWGVAKVPETFVVDPNGVVVVKTIDRVTEAELDRFITMTTPTTTEPADGTGAGR